MNELFTFWNIALGVWIIANVAVNYMTRDSYEWEVEDGPFKSMAEGPLGTLLIVWPTIALWTIPWTVIAWWQARREQK